MDVLVTGAAGYLGRHLVSALLARGDTVRALVLPTEDATWLRKRDVAVWKGDVRRPETLRAAMRGVDGVFHLAGLVGAWRPMREYRDVHVTGTENVCRVALETGVHRLVHVSTAMVYRMIPGEAITEDTPLVPLPEPYPLTKAEGDRKVQRMILRDHLPAVIIRPGTIFGPSDRMNFGRTCDRLRAGSGLVIGSGRNTVGFVYVTDVVRGMLLALDRECAVGQVYNIANDKPVTQRELLWAIAEEVGARPPRIHVPYKMLYALAFAAERVATLTGYKNPPLVTRQGVVLFGGDMRLAVDKARRELGYTPEVPIMEGVRLAAKWYRQNGTMTSESSQLSTHLEWKAQARDAEHIS